MPLLEQLIRQLGSVELDASELVLEVDGRPVPAARVITIKLARTERASRQRPAPDEDEEWEWQIALARARARTDEMTPRPRPRPKAPRRLRRAASGTEPPPALRRGPVLPARARRALRNLPMRKPTLVPPPLPPPPDEGEIA